MSEENIDAWRHLTRKPLASLLEAGARLRQNRFGSRIELCAIINIRNGNCAMDCKFCAQSCHNSVSLHPYPLLSNEKLLEALEKLSGYPLKHIGLVASGAALGGDEFSRLLAFIATLQPELRDKICLSLGRLSPDQLKELKKAGIRRYHHNLETAKEFYPRICSTQRWEDRHATALTAMEAGLELCSGFLFGLGENWEDRISLALELKKSGIKNIPMNFLDPVPGTTMQSMPTLTIQETLRIIALFRHILPEATLRVCGGRAKALGSRQELMFMAGANALMTGDFLTTKGKAIAGDLQVLEKLGLFPQ